METLIFAPKIRIFGLAIHLSCIWMVGFSYNIWSAVIVWQWLMPDDQAGQPGWNSAVLSCPEHGKWSGSGWPVLGTVLSFASLMTLLKNNSTSLPETFFSSVPSFIYSVFSLPPAHALCCLQCFASSSSFPLCSHTSSLLHTWFSAIPDSCFWNTPVIFQSTQLIFVPPTHEAWRFYRSPLAVISIPTLQTLQEEARSNSVLVGASPALFAGPRFPS